MAKLIDHQARETALMWLPFEIREKMCMIRTGTDPEVAANALFSESQDDEHLPPSVVRIAREKVRNYKPTDPLPPKLSEMPKPKRKYRPARRTKTKNQTPKK